MQTQIWTLELASLTQTYLETHKNDGTVFFACRLLWPDLLTLNLKNFITSKWRQGKKTSQECLKYIWEFSGPN